MILVREEMSKTNGDRFGPSRHLRKCCTTAPSLSNSESLRTIQPDP